MSSSSLKILIADDEVLAQDSIKILLDKVMDCEVVATASNGKEALDKVLTLQPDIVFMDIQMPHILGTEVVERLGSLSNTYFIFVTAFDDKAIKAFELNALDYLLKPYSDERFYKSLNRAKEYIKTHSLNARLESFSANRLSKSFKEEFAIKSVGKIEFVRCSEIVYIKSSGNYVELITTMGKFLSRGSINNLEKELDPKSFIRIHRSTIIKRVEIKELQNYFNGEYLVIMKNGDQLKLSRSYKEAIKSLITFE